MKGRVQAKKGYWYVVIERGKGQTPVWRKTGLPEKNNKRRAEGMIEQIISDYEASIKGCVRELNLQSADVCVPEQKLVKETTPRNKNLQACETLLTNNPIFSDVVKMYLAVAKISVKENTYEKYRDAAETHIIPYFEKLGMSIGEIDTPDLQDYIACKMKVLKNSTLKTHKTILNQTFKYAMRPLRLIKSSPMVDVVLSKVEEITINYYDEKQINALLRCISCEGQQIVTPIILGAYYGLRKEEILGLQWSAVNFDNHTIEIRRTAIKAGKKTIYAPTVKAKSSHRVLPMYPDVAKYLKYLYAHQRKMQATMKKGYIKNLEVCKWDDGHLVRPDYVSHRFNALLKKYGMPPLKFHELRHSTASLLLSRGYSLKEIGELLGHASPRSTEIYAHLQKNEAKQKMVNTIGGSLGLPEIAF